MHGSQNQYKGQSKSIHHQHQTQSNMLMHNQHQPGTSIKDKDRKPNFQELGHSPQPQIRIRTEHHPGTQGQFSIKKNNDLMKYDDRLMTDSAYPQSQIQNYQNIGPQNGSATQQLQHRGSNKHLPQIQSSSSQRNKKPAQHSYIENTPQKQTDQLAIRQGTNGEKGEYARSLTKTLNQTQYNSLKSSQNPNMKTDQLMAQTQIHQRHTSGQSQVQQQNNQSHLVSQQVSRSAYNGTGRKLVSSQNHNNNGTSHHHQMYNAETPDTTKKRQQILNPNTNARQQIHVSMSPSKLNKVPITAQSTCGVNFQHQIISQLGSNPAQQPLLNNFQNSTGPPSQQTPSLFTNPAFSRMQTQKCEVNHNSIAALMYNGAPAASNIAGNQSSGHNSSAIINLQSQQVPTGSDSQMSQKKPSSSTTQKALWNNSTIQQQQQQQSMQLFAQKTQNQTVTLNYRGQAASQNQNIKNDQRLLMSGNKQDLQQNVFSGSSLTHSGNKIIGGGGTAQSTNDGQLTDALVPSGKQLSQTSNLNKSLAQQQLSSHMAYK